MKREITSAAAEPLPSVAATRTAVVAGEISPGAAARQALRRAEAVGAGAHGLNILLATSPAASLGEPAWRTEQVASGAAPGVLAGVPVVVKDNIATLELPTTCASRMLEGYISPYEATAVARLRAAGALVVAKSNMDEFGMGSSTEYSAFGPARHPLDPSRVPGGSSGGSAAAVAAGIVPVALGSETGGSVRQPAAFCGVVGIKPTYGRVSRFGLVAFASSLDQIGVFGATVEDAARVLEVIAGHDPLDATTAPAPTPRVWHPPVGSLEGVIVGRPAEFYPASLDPQIAERCARALRVLRELGATIREVSLPLTPLAVPVYYIIAPAEASSNLARFDGVRFGRRFGAGSARQFYETTRSHGFGPEVKRRVLLGTYVLSAGYYDAYYRRATELRARIADEYRRTFASGVHVLFTPTTPGTAFALGSRTSDPYEMYMSDVFTVTANLTGAPALSLPIGRADGLPVGGQLIAPHFQESAMCRVAAELERALGAGAHG